ncbi:hypothetical protein AXF42_Ash016258 [Apostasia shenzhenica]|uniref:Myosin-2 n=1 Tax=Apostasia shenzhenica TaxID=1088818 RepID=A0A2H9ZXC7_9ASPA|nr:hypothetical protein AXF42_Ash016258 [Apostasia shenzhenica]
MRLFDEAMGPAAARSSLEVMLDAIRKTDEQPNDLPPSLPTRPTSRGRLPSSRKSLPINFAVKSAGQEFIASQREDKIEEESDEKSKTMGDEGIVKMKWVQESPDPGVPELLSYQEKPETVGSDDSKCTTSSTFKLYGQFKSVEAINYFRNKKLCVWCWLPEEKWELGNIESFSGTDANILLLNGKILRLPFENILPANPEIHDAVNDIVKLSYLNEPSVLHCLRYRFSQDMIYTKAGSVLLVFKLFKDLALCEKDTMAACRQKVGESAHVFAVADKVFDELSRGRRNQSITISGESGSGKSETVKITMQYLAILAGDEEVGFKVLKANEILESFGNAKTLQNKNSSRFRKIVELHFTDTGKMCGAKYETCVTNAANLLGCEVNELALALSTQKSHLGNYSTVQKLTLSQAFDNRDALAESVYACLFDWIVVQINKSVQVAESHSRTTISVLDICGLEYSPKNGFEQFYTNYVNERMQQYFFSHLLKREQEEYTLDGIEWSHITFPDNIECLNIFEKIDILETARTWALQRIVCIQKYLRGLLDRRSFNAMKKGVTSLQSYINVSLLLEVIRAEGARHEFQNMVKQHRAAFFIQKQVKQSLAEKAFATQQQNIVLLQSAIRGWLAREQFSKRRNMELTKCNQDSQQFDPLEVSVMAELKNRVLKAETELRLKREENSSLRQQLQQYEIRWLDYDAKMKSMEETWQKQMTSLQMSLAAAKRSLATNDAAGVAGRLNASPNYHYFNSEDTMSIETHTAEGTPAKPSGTSGVGMIRTPDGARNAVTQLVKEFEQRRRVFDDDAGFLVEVKSGQSISDINPDEEFKNLKAQFAAWKKDYEVRLRETKVALQKLGNAEATKARRKWWGKRRSTK